MTTQELGWQDAIVSVLQDADKPLHYQEITKIIGERGLRTLTGATPDATVNSHLSRMTKEGHPSYDERLRKVERGVFEYAFREDIAVPEQKADDLDDEEQDSNPDLIVGVPAFALYWDKDKVKWGTSGKILGRQNQKAEVVDFAEQQGVYILHNNYSVVYVGRTTENLYNRLRAHYRDYKSARWNKFSWFGFRGVDHQTGKLTVTPTKASFDSLVSILESVLIEALQPPINGQQGDHLGIKYDQVPHPEIAKQQSLSLLRSLTG